MCTPLFLGTALPVGVAGPPTAGLLGFGGTFAPFSGTLASAVSNINLGTAANLAGAGFGAYGIAYSGAVQEANYEYQAGMMLYNKKISENNALMARRASEFDADTFDLDKRRMLARQRTGYAKSGVVIDQDTPLDISAETAAEAQLERLAILYKGETQAEAYLQQATGQEAAAARYRLNAQMAGTSATIGVGKELAQGAYKQYRYGAGTSLLG